MFVTILMMVSISLAVAGLVVLLAVAIQEYTEWRLWKAADDAARSFYDENREKMETPQPRILTLPPAPKSQPIVDQPAPKATSGRPVWELVIEDMKERDQIGRHRYGVPLQAHNGRDALVDAYQEALDLAVYLRQAIEEQNR